MSILSNILWFMHIIGVFLEVVGVVVYNCNASYLTHENEIKSIVYDLSNNQN